MSEKIKEVLIELGKNYPAPFKEKKGNIFLLDFLVAKRGTFLNIQKLTYSARLRIDEQNKQVKFFEILKEIGAGLGSGGADEFSTGFGFKLKKTVLMGEKKGRYYKRAICTFWQEI